MPARGVDTYRREQRLAMHGGIPPPPRLWRQPDPVIFISPIPNINGELSVEGITDLWSTPSSRTSGHPLSRRWRSCRTPFELLTTARDGALGQLREGLGFFSI